MNERTPLYCHACENDFVAELDMGLNEIECPHCSHIHYRVVEDGRVTSERYRSSMQTHIATTSTMTISNSTGGTTASGTGFYFLQQSWGDSTTVNILA